jgi:GNAT superfamily N-acetyltransferase
MIEFLVSIKHNHPVIWEFVERINGVLFRLLYGNISAKAESVLEGHSVAGCGFALIKEEDISPLENFLQAQTPETLKWFNPHAFDAKTLRKLYRNPAFLMMKVYNEDSGRIAGYFFLRCFFIGQAFTGILVDPEWQNLGIASRIWQLQTEICAQCKLRLRATIASENKSCIAACHNGTTVSELQQLDNGYLAMECKINNQQ